jgi:hypothetical protein
MMHKNILWKAFLAAIFVTTLWYTIVAVYRYNDYSSLQTQAPVTEIQWQTIEDSSESFSLQAHYRYEFNGKSFTGSSPWKEVYRNSWAAEQDIKEFSKVKWKVWIDPNHPDHSSLQKYFPFKECISSALLWGIFLYFLSLGFYVAKIKH